MTLRPLYFVDVLEPQRVSLPPTAQPRGCKGATMVVESYTTEERHYAPCLGQVSADDLCPAHLRLRDRLQRAAAHAAQ